MMSKRKYDDSYIKWGITKFVEKDGTERPQCVLCYKVLAEASMKPSKLRAHLTSIHATHQNYSEDRFRRKKALFKTRIPWFGTVSNLRRSLSLKPLTK